MGGSPRGEIPSTSGTVVFDRKLAFALEEGNREWHRLINAVIRGAGAGLCLRGGLNLLAWVFAVISPARRKRLLSAPLQTVIGQVLDTLRYSAFLGSLSGVYVGADEGIANLFGRKRTATWRSFIAGLLAGPTILLTGLKSRHHSLALYILLRGVALLIRCGNKSESHPWLRKALAPTRLEHGDTALMCLSLSQLAHSWILRPGTLPPAYVNFLNHHGGKRPVVYRALRELGNNNTNGLQPRKLASLQGTRYNDFCDKLPCEFLHPGHHCSTNVLAFLPGAYLRAIPVYAPVYIIPAILVHRKKLLQPGARDIWTKVMLGTLRSSAFLASYCALAWGGACVGFTTGNTFSSRQLYLSAWTGGLATLIEKKSRRMELALYCASRALEAWALCLVEWGYISPKIVPPRLDVIMFSLAVGSILHCYSDDHGRHRDVFKSKYLNVLDFIMGNRGLDKGTIQHVPSTQDLLAAQGLDSTRIRRSISHLAASLSLDSMSQKSDISAASSHADIITAFHIEDPEDRDGTRGSDSE